MRIRAVVPARIGLTPAEARTLARLDTPTRIQDFVDAIPHNFEVGGETYLPVREVLRQRRAHCLEGALLSACALWLHGDPPLLLDLKAEQDVDHVLAVYRRNGLWGAISKTNHVWLRFRDPVYRTLRELAMSYVHEYHNQRYRKTLRSYSGTLDLRRFDPAQWVTGPRKCIAVVEALDFSRHYPLFPPRLAKTLRRRDALERRANALLWHERKP
jgi:hypothetical protein